MPRHPRGHMRAHCRVPPAPAFECPVCYKRDRPDREGRQRSIISGTNGNGSTERAPGSRAPPGTGGGAWGEAGPRGTRARIDARGGGGRK
jgi:hypothetical protein